MHNEAVVGSYQMPARSWTFSYIILGVAVNTTNIIINKSIACISIHLLVAHLSLHVSTRLGLHQVIVQDITCYWNILPMWACIGGVFNPKFLLYSHLLNFEM
jgi:hypothetical protein